MELKHISVLFFNLISDRGYSSYWNYYTLYYTYLRTSLPNRW